MRRLSLFSTAVMALVGGVVACSDEQECAASYKDLGAPEAVCAVTSTTGGTGQRACYEQPQICPDFSPVRFCAREQGTQTSVNVLLDNRGELPMTIRSIKVRGDTRCAFKKAQFAPAIGTVLEPGQSLVMRFQYDAPTTPGEDHALIEVASDAENFPTLSIDVCGESLATGQTAAMCLACQDRSAEPYTDCFEQP